VSRAPEMKRKTIRIYADTSVFGGAFDPEFSEASSAFWDQVKAGRFHLVLSPILTVEIAVAPKKVKALYRTIEPLAEMLPIAEATRRLREAYLRAKIVSPQWMADALHVAHATVCGCQMIVSWNFRHIVHFEKIALYNAINVQEGYSPIGIHTPQEVIEYEEKKEL